MRSLIHNWLPLALVAPSLVLGLTDVSSWTASAYAQPRSAPRSVKAVEGVPAGVVVEGQPAAQPGQNPTASAEKKPDGEKPKDGEKKAGEKTDGPRPVTQRPVKPQTPPNPDELKTLKPDENGKVKFNLKGQPWPDVLEWLAETSNKSLDWQELPSDYLNLVTQQGYAIDEAHDLLNRHLLSRGFTMITNGETISVVNVSKINPGMVPRVDPTQLKDLPDNDYVKVSLALDWLLADEAENELKPMLSPNGKLTHLSATNRLEAMDSVINLRQIWDVIQEEQSGGKQERLVREFKLKHTKADEVLDQLYAILGVNKPQSLQKRRGGSSGGGMDPNMMGQFQQAMQQLVQPLQQMAQNQRRLAPPRLANLAKSASSRTRRKTASWRTLRRTRWPSSRRPSKLWMSPPKTATTCCKTCNACRSIGSAALIRSR